MSIIALAKNDAFCSILEKERRGEVKIGGKDEDEEVSVHRQDPEVKEIDNIIMVCRTGYISANFSVA